MAVMLMMVMHIHRHAVQVAIRNVPRDADAVLHASRRPTGAAIHWRAQLSAGHRQNATQFAADAAAASASGRRNATHMRHMSGMQMALQMSGRMRVHMVRMMMRMRMRMLRMHTGRMMVQMVPIALRQIVQLVAQDARYRADARHIVLVANALGQQPIANLPRKDARILLLQLAYVADDLRRGDTRLGAANGAGQYGAGLVIARQDLRDAAVRDAQLARDVARPDAETGQLDDAHARCVGQRASVDEEAAQLVDFAVLLGLCVCG